MSRWIVIPALIGGACLLAGETVHVSALEDLGAFLMAPLSVLFLIELLHGICTCVVEGFDQLANPR